MRREIRIKFLQKLGQNTAVNPSVPTAQVTLNKQIPPAPSVIASDIYPNIRGGYSSAQVIIINNIIQKLNVAANVSTGGTYNLQVLRNKGFSFDPSSFQSPDQKNIMTFFLKVFQKLLNSGNIFPAPLNKQQLIEIVDTLIKAPELINLSQVNPTGPIAQQISSDFQQEIKNNLLKLIQ